MTIENDGKVMEAEDSKHENNSGIGLRNIDRRLNQLYDQRLVITSTPEHGTFVTFQIPK